MDFFSHAEARQGRWLNEERPERALLASYAARCGQESVTGTVPGLPECRTPERSASTRNPITSSDAEDEVLDKLCVQTQQPAPLALGQVGWSGWFGWIGLAVGKLDK